MLLKTSRITMPFEKRLGSLQEKFAWLQRRGKECGDLYGVLLLVHGMPVALTDHIDRNPQKQLLRGKIGHIHSWITEK